MKQVNVSYFQASHTMINLGKQMNTTSQLSVSVRKEEWITTQCEKYERDKDKILGDQSGTEPSLPWQVKDDFPLRR